MCADSLVSTSQRILSIMSTLAHTLSHTAASAAAAVDTSPLNPRAERAKRPRDCAEDVAPLSIAAASTVEQTSVAKRARTAVRASPEDAAASGSAGSSPIFFKSNNGNGYACFSNFWPSVKPSIALAVEARIAAVYTAAAAAAASAATSASSAASATAAAPPRNSFTIDGVLYRSVEHYYHSCKYSAAHPALSAQIVAAPTALAAKQLNTRFRKTHPVDCAWFTLENQVAVMRTACEAKFKQNPRLAALLLSTGDTPLHESRGRTKDIWALQPDDPRSDQLGKILTAIRLQLKQQSAGAGH